MLLFQTNDSTTLHLAAAGGHAEVVQVLLEAGASASDENAVGYQFHCYMHFLCVHNAMETYFKVSIANFLQPQ